MDWGGDEGGFCCRDWGLGEAGIPFAEFTVCSLVLLDDEGEDVSWAVPFGTENDVELELVIGCCLGGDKDRVCCSGCWGW